MKIDPFSYTPDDLLDLADCYDKGLEHAMHSWARDDFNATQAALVALEMTAWTMKHYLMSDLLRFLYERNLAAMNGVDPQSITFPNPDKY